VLRELHISGLGVIEDLDLALHRGLNVLTGETGAGKTMVTVGLSLAIGSRASASMVRSGSAALRVQARFDAPDTAGDWAEDGDVVLARMVSAEGKSSARISGQIATASALTELGGRLVELHGQHQAQRLRSASTQTAFLDRYAGSRHVASLAEFLDAFEQLRKVASELERLGSAARERERELDLLAYQVREIEAVGPSPGESEALSTEEARLGHVERLLEQAGIAERLLGDEGGAVDRLADVATAVASAAALDPGAGEMGARADGALADLGELARDLRTYREGLAADPERLNEVRERIGALKALQRKYGATDEDVVAFHTEASARMADLSGADERLEELTRKKGELSEIVGAGAATVTAGRREASPILAAAIETELHDLGMPGAQVEVRLEPLDEIGPSGAERVVLGFGAGPGQEARPLASTASGGELSRAMLACRSVLADLDDVSTLVFDEVDAGIGGEAGLAVGRRLARLAETRQVLVVTHLPQIACFADRHVRVEKRGSTASVQVLDDDERVRELSRMLAGLPDSDRAVSHARELLAEAGRPASRG
jgi:DNA repair protein RecN (Recombination protein N)